MSAPALVFALVAALAVFTLLFRRRAYLPFLVAGIASALIGLFVLFAPLDTAVSLLGVPIRLDSTWQILGRPMNLDAQDRAGVGFLFLVGALFFSIGWTVAPGRSFVPAGLIALGLLTGALIIEPFLFAAIFLELAAMACVLVLIPPGSRSEGRVLNLLVLYTMAMMAILFTGWLLENVGVTSVTPELALRVILLLGLGFLILLFVPPFHYWLPGIVEHVNPFSLAFVAIILQSSGTFFLLRFLDNFAWMRADPRVATAIQITGIFMIAFGTIVVIARISFLKIAIYLLIADIGVSLLAISSGLIELAIGLTSVRVISLGLWGLGAALMTKSGTSSGAGWEAPLATSAGIVGLLSLAGLPLTAGFPWRWTLLSNISRAEAMLVVLSMLLMLWTVLRWTRILFGEQSDEHQPDRELAQRLTVVLMVSACFALGIFPQLALPWVAQATAGFTP